MSCSKGHIYIHRYTWMFRERERKTERRNKEEQNNEKEIIEKHTVSSFLRSVCIVCTKEKTRQKVYYISIFCWICILYSSYLILLRSYSKYFFVVALLCVSVSTRDYKKHRSGPGEIIPNRADEKLLQLFSLLHKYICTYCKLCKCIRMN